MRASGLALVAGLVAWSAEVVAQECIATVQPDVAWGARPSDNSHPDAAFRIMSHLICRGCQPEVSMLLTAGPAPIRAACAPNVTLSGEFYSGYDGACQYQVQLVWGPTNTELSPQARESVQKLLTSVRVGR